MKDKTVLVTRSRSQSSEFIDEIQARGGKAIAFPVIELRPIADPLQCAQLEQAIQRLAYYDWLILTSVNGVHFFKQKMDECKVSLDRLVHTRVVAVGPKTAEALTRMGIVVYAIPQTYDAEGLWQLLEPELRIGQKALLPTGNLARDYLPTKLNAYGVTVTKIDLYETVMTDEDASEVITLLQRRRIDVITFTSSSSVHHFMAILAKRIPNPIRLLEGVTIVSIGPLTTRTAIEVGMHVQATAPEATVDAMVKTLDEIENWGNV